MRIEGAQAVVLPGMSKVLQVLVKDFERSIFRRVDAFVYEVCIYLLLAGPPAL